MIDHQVVDSMFEFSPPVDEQIEDSKPLEQLGVHAARFAHELIDLVPPGPLRTSAIIKLQSVVGTAAEAIRKAQMRKDRAMALSARDAQP